MEGSAVNNLEMLKKLCHDVQKKWEVTYGIDGIEDLLLVVLNFLKLHPENHSEFIDYFASRVTRDEQFPYEILVFCMRELQWLEIKEAAIAENAKTDDWRIISVMNEIIAVYESEWEDADLYEYYSKPNKTK